MKKLPANLRSKILKNEKGSSHTTFKIGGKLPLWIEPYDLKELLVILDILKKNRQKITIIGAGSNVLIRDDGIKSVFIKLNSKSFKKINVTGRNLTVGAGASLSSLINCAAKNALGGLEALSGIPASVGGAIYTNASSNNVAISDFIKTITIIDSDLEVQTITKKDAGFFYRGSRIGKNIILQAIFELKKCSKNDILKKKKFFLIKKRETQPLGFKSAGCIFKNPQHSEFSSGQLIDMAGFKGVIEGGAKVSDKHANYILNLSNATALDVKKLITRIKRTVKKKYDIELETEITFI